MFHHAHSFIASKLYKSQNNLLLVGSIIPDLAVMGIIKWQGGLHGEEAVKGFYQFIQMHPGYIDLFKGIKAHNIVDDFTHIDYKGKTGYAFQNNKELAKLIREFYELGEESAVGKAHNFIESAVDILLLKENPDAQTKLKNAIKAVDKTKLSNLLSDYFSVENAKLLDSITDFLNLFTKYDFAQKENWVMFWADLEKLLSLKDIGDQKRKELIDKSIDIIKNTYGDFLKYAEVEGMKKI